MRRPRLPSPLLLLPLLAVAVGLSVVAGASGKVSHAAWPRRDGRLLEAPDVLGNRHHGPDHGVTLRGGRRNDEILGGHGSDHLYGGGGNDVIWGDAVPGDFKRQSDLIIAGSGDDIVYTGHGWNIVFAGPGDDVVHAEFGSGTIDCGSGHDVVYLTRLTRPNYRLRHCESVRIVGGRQ